MGSPDLPPDPYLALGVAKDATAAAIKSQYRKLVLKFHPDKVKDEEQKKVAADEFHKIQTAYEIVGDEDKRARYDAQCKLVELRREVLQRHAPSRDRSTNTSTARPHPSSSDSPRAAQSFYPRGPDRQDRVSPTYEERRPSYASRDYFDAPPRPSSKKASDRDRSSKRHPGREESDRSKSAAKETKKAERSNREERNKKATKDLRKDRERRTFYVEDEMTASESDEYERATRRMRDEDDLRRAREALHEQARRQKDDANLGVHGTDERVKKIFSQYDDAKQYIVRSSRRPEPERRPSPVRKSSSKEKMAYVRTRDGRPGVVRRESTRPNPVCRDTASRRPSVDVRVPIDGGDAPRVERRPPTLTQSKSSPIDVRPPFYDRQRSQSVQIDRDDAPPPPVRRSETMPNSPSASREHEARRNRETAAPPKSSHLRQAEFADVTPEPNAANEYTTGSSNNKYRYGAEYADDREYPTPDGYRTEIREPVSSARHAKYTRSPSPEPDRERERDRDWERNRGRERSDREKLRQASARYNVEAQRPPGPTRTTSKTYAYPQSATEVKPSVRPSISRENSARGDQVLFGEVSSKFAKASYSIPSSPQDAIRYTGRPLDDLRTGGIPPHTRRSSQPHATYVRNPPVHVR